MTVYEHLLQHSPEVISGGSLFVTAVVAWIAGLSATPHLARPVRVRR
ncbi:MAG: hypothetical protein AAFQ51_03445 [Pseudomonadota bacterium]